MVSQSTPRGGRWDAPREDSAPEAQDEGTAAETAAEGLTAEEPAEGQDPLAVLRAEAEAARAEAAELKDQLLRALAEAENIRSRARREREEALRYAAAPLARDLLPVADNLRRALESAAGGEAAADPRLQSLLVGVEMTEKSLLDALGKHGVAPIRPLGERLDPHRHEAMLEVHDPARPPGTVAQVFETGYLLHDRLLRPARVAVAKGGAAPTPGERVDTEV